VKSSVPERSAGTRGKGSSRGKRPSNLKIAGGALALLLTACPHDEHKQPPPATSSVDAAPEAEARGPEIPVDGSAAGGTSQVPKDANVILVTIDCLRADMPWEGYPRPIAPNLT